MIPKVVAGKYRLLRRLGAGGMGVVYEAEHTSTLRRVAIKILSSDLVRTSMDPDSADLSSSLLQRRDEQVARFEREARSVGAIDSQHVVQVLDAGTDAESGRPYMAMEFLTGEDLQQVVGRLGPLPYDVALRVAAQACVGLAKAHEAGVIHRDVKMANLFLAGRDGDRLVVKVLDFGIAKLRMDRFHQGHERGITHTGSMLGSPHYMSPEQAQGLKSIDHRTDVWSLGVVLYKCLTGLSPFEAESLGQLILSICSERPRPIQDVAPWIPPRAAEIVHRALRRDPNDRFLSMAQMLAAIEVLLPEGYDLHARMLVPLPKEQRDLIAPRRLSDRSPSVDRDANTAQTPPSSTGSGSLRSQQPMGRTHDGLTTMPGLTGRSSRSAKIVAIAVTGVAGLLAVRALQSGAPTASPEQVVVASSALPASTPSVEASAPDNRVARVAIEPKDARVEIDGQRVLPKDGAVELEGSLGSTHVVRIETQQGERTVEVVISENGAVPPRVSFKDEPPAPIVPQPTKPIGGRRAEAATAKPAPPPAAPSPRPSSKPVQPPAQGVGPTETFE